MNSKYIIKSKKDFKAFFDQKNIVSSRIYIFYFNYKKRNDHPRFGISINKKHFKKAVTRNKIKRQIKSMLQSFYKDINKNIDILIMVRSNFLENTFDNNKKELIEQFKKIKIL